MPEMFWWFYWSGALFLAWSAINEESEPEESRRMVVLAFVWPLLLSIAFVRGVFDIIKEIWIGPTAA